MASNNIRSTHLPKSVTRRDILRFAAAGAGMTFLGGMRPHLQRAEGAPLPGHKRIVVIYCYGGYDGLNLLVPISLDNYYTARELREGGTGVLLGDIGIKPEEVLPINGSTDYGLHPSFVRLKALWDEGDAGAVKLVGYPFHDRSHFISQDIYSQGVRGSFSPLPIDESGWIARVSNEMNLSATGAVALGVGRPLEVEGANNNPLLISSMSAFQFQNDYRHSANHRLRMETVQQVLQGYSGSTLDAEAALALQQGHDLAEDMQTAVANYESVVDYRPPNFTYVPSPGRGLQDVARMIQGGFDGRVFFTGFGGWDTHAGQGGAETEGAQSRLITRLDHAIGSFADDCKAMSNGDGTTAWDDTIVCVVSEFGRTNEVNSGLGTDHGHANQFFLAGGGLNGGLYGPDLEESHLAEDTPWLPYGVDFRDIFRDLVSNHLGADGDTVFPETQEINLNLGLIS